MNKTDPGFTDIVSDNLVFDDIVFDGTPLPLEAIVAIAEGTARVVLSDAPAFVARIDKGPAFLQQLLDEEGVIYGVTTGYGDSCTVSIPSEQVAQLPMHLTQFHGCGLGAYLDAPAAMAVLATRLVSLCRGLSGVRYALLQKIAELLQHRIAPLIPAEGSVGASGDLTPLSYVAAVLMGQRDVIYRGELSRDEQRKTADVFAEIGIEPLLLRPKEGLAIMNGTAVMTALACMAYKRADYLLQLGARITSMVSVAIQGNASHFDEWLFDAKPHPGQQKIAGWIRSDLDYREHPRNSERLQDRYSLRCAPHVLGVLADAMPLFRSMIENELNSANDNPVIDAEHEVVLHGGHFYGGHIAFAMDSMKNCIANIADLLDRQLATLVDARFNNGLPPNLSGADKNTAAINHGFKAVQILVSANTAEALKLTMPASVFSRSTECHNQDKVSMGTIAARDCLRVLELTEQVSAACLLACTQALLLRERSGALHAAQLSPSLQAMLATLRTQFSLVEQDRPLEHELRNTVAHIRQRQWPLFAQGNS
ncbi:MAG TPA: aromatic amino acid ammonia-lyase [Pseudomonadales bacterium]|nr:aromatic amino acid ammonia-lyase [Pseudomonadales bacterium]